MKPDNLPQMTEYGTKEYKEHKSVYTQLDEMIWVSPISQSLTMVLYHRTEGYKPAGAAVTWISERWGYSYKYPDGTTSGQSYITEKEALDSWERLKKQIEENKKQMLKNEEELGDK